MDEVKIDYYRIFLDDNCKEEFIIWFVDIMYQKHGISKEKIINFLGKQLRPWITQCVSWGLCYNICMCVLKPIRYDRQT
jgi:hypothetical protein